LNLLPVTKPVPKIPVLNAGKAIGVLNSFTMNRLGLLLLISLAVLTGCARQYVMKLSNGTRITTASKPKLKHGYYTYKDAAGNEARPIPQGRVLEIEPASMAAEEKNRFAPPKPR
jgi:Bacterial protein of unknown function (DUF903)